MLIDRRDFLRLLGLGAGAAGLGGCGGDWLLPEERIALALRGPGEERSVHTVCGLCEGGCGLTVRLVDELPVGLSGGRHHALNRGGVCPVGQAALEVLYSPQRIRHPQRRGEDGRLQPLSWDGALSEVAVRLRDLLAAGQGDRVAFLVQTPGQLLQELVQRFADALGCPNVAHPPDPGRLAYALTQGIDAVPGFDLTHADLVLSFGLDLYEDGPAPMHAIAAMVGSRRVEERGRLLHVGTRLSPSAAKAEEHVPVRPGTHGAFALGVAHVLVREGTYDQEFVADHTLGFEDWTDDRGERRLGFRRLLMERYYPDRSAKLCGCDPTRIIRVARRLAGASRPVVVFGGEAVWGSNATWTALAVHSLNALVGSFGRPGGVVAPPQIPFTPLEPLPRLTAADPGASLFSPGGVILPDVDPVEALARGVLDENRPVEVLVVSGWNPVHDSPAGGRLREALERIPLVISLASLSDETAACADLILPSHHFLESWEDHTTPPGVSFATLGLSRPVLEPLYETRQPGDTMLELSQRIGGLVAEALPWAGYVDYLKHRLQGLVVSGQGTVMSGSFEEAWVRFLEERGWRFLEHQDVEGFWRDLTNEGGWWNPVQDPADWARLFRTPSGRFEFFSRDLHDGVQALGDSAGGGNASPAEARKRGIAALGLEAEGDEAFLPHFEAPAVTGEGPVELVPFRLLTARGHQGSVSPMLLEMFGYPLLEGWRTWAELAPDTAHALGVEDGDLVALTSPRGTAEAVVRIQHGAVPGVVHLPLGLGHRSPYGDEERRGESPLRLVSAVPDSLAGTLSLGSTRVTVQVVRRRSRGGPAPIHGGHG